MKRIAVVTVICAILVAVVGVVVMLSRPRVKVPQTTEIDSPEPMRADEKAVSRKPNNPFVLPSAIPNEPFVPAPNEKVSAAMNETVVKNLIANVRVAAAKGDDATRKILLNGLKKDAPTARRLLQEEINVASDPATKNVLNDILDDLKGEAR